MKTRFLLGLAPGHRAPVARPFSFAPAPRRRAVGLPLLLAAAAAAVAGCSGGEAGPPAPAVEPLRIAVAMPISPDSPDEGLPEFEWALESINAAGGVAGRPLALEYKDPRGQDLEALGSELANDDRYAGVIGPPGSAGLFEVAHFFVEQDKPIVSTTSTADDLLRAYGGKGAVWRTRESDIAQTELLVRFARESGSKKPAVLASLELGGSTFFSWFGFFAAEVGYPEDAVHIVALESMKPCNDEVAEALSTMPDFLFVAPNSPEELKCIIQSLPPPGKPRPRIVLADTGIDPFDLEMLGDAAGGVEGFTGAGDAAHEKAFEERFPGARLAPHGPSEYDAVLLLAYGLEVSGGDGGQALISGMKAAASGTAESSWGWDAAGIAGTLGALRAGERPRLQGATGPLAFEPELYMDLAASTLRHYEVEAQKLVFDQSFWTGDASFLSSQGAFVKPALGPKDVDLSAWTPKVAKTDTWAVIAALSSSWSNYRHQADALQQYRMLRANGVTDDHIVLILADDIASAAANALPGVVRNEPGGDDLYEEPRIDYNLSLTSEDLANILTGTVTEATPTVIEPTASSNVYLYLVGHGGTEGIPLGAQSTGEGLSGGSATFSPTALREALCSLSAQQRFRRVLAVIESCYSGAFGAAAYDGLERGCAGASGDVPLEGVVLLTAANSREVSFAGGRDDEVPAWVNDSFSRHFVENALGSPAISLADLYTDTYRATAGSHPSVFNADHAGRLTLVPFAELVTP
jgi:ABC-type branched-subunit amino acid transport system substrate-binding protein